MTSNEIYNINDIKNDTLIFNDIRESRGGSYITDIENLKYIYLPKHIAKEGFSFNNKSCYVDIELSDSPFLKFLLDFDIFCKETILKCTEKWFSYNLTSKQIDDFYVSSINYRKKFNKEPYLRLKIPVSKQKISIKISDENNTEIDIDRLPMDELIMSGVIDIKGLKFLKQDVICELELASIIVHNSKPKLNITGLIKKKRNQNKDSKNDNQLIDNQLIDIRKDDSRKEDSRREDNQSIDSRREDSKREDSRKEDSRREDSKREDSKREDSKREDSIYENGTYSEINRIEESKDKIIKEELESRLYNEKVLAQKVFKEAHDIMESYELKREYALRQAEIVKELELELSNLE